MGNKQLYQMVFAPAIRSLTSGAIFRLRDLRPDPPALVGRYVYEDRYSLGIEKVRNPGGDCNLWRKL